MIISNKLKQEIKSQTSNVFVTSAIIKDLNSGLSENIEQLSTTPIESLSIMTNPVGALPIGKLEFEIGSVGDTQMFSENTTYEIHLQNKYTFDDGEIETFDTKKYVTTEIKYDQSTGRTRFVALDYLNLLNKEYVPIDIAYPVRFDTWVQTFLDGVGLSANLTNLFQKEYIVEQQPNFLNVSNKQVLQKILEHALSFGFIDDNNDFKIVRVSSLVTGSNVDTIDGSIKSYKANPDYFKTLGINTLVLGLQSDIADENVAKEDSAMIAIDGVVEMRLDDLPFAYDEQSKRNIIDSMFNEIKGFKYHAYDSESKLFYLEFGSLVRQEISDDGNYYNIPILSYTRNYNGSIMTKHASISESVIKTENAQKQFSPRKKTEIRLNKIDQEFSVVHEKTDELDTKYSKISSDIDSINLGVYKKTEVDQKLEDIELTPGPQGIPGSNGADGKPTYIWTKYADSPISGMSDSGEGKQFMGMAFNKSTPIASTNYNDYQWVFMPQNMQLGAKNLFVIDNAYIPSTDSFMKEKGSTVLQIMGTDPYNNPKNIQIGMNGRLFEPGTYALSGYLTFGFDGNLKYSDFDLQQNGEDVEVLRFFIDEETGYFEIIQKYNSQIVYPIDFKINKLGYYYNVFENIQFERGDFVTDYRLSEGDVLKWIKDTEDDLKDNIIQTQENKANIRINTESITSEVSERIEMGNRLSSETSSLLEQHKEGFDFIISKIIDNQELTDGEVQSLRTWLTIDIHGLMIGADGSQMTLHAMNDRIAFKENGVTISEWESGTMSVDNIIAKLSIVIGTHLIEKFLAPFGVTSLVRMVD